MKYNVAKMFAGNPLSILFGILLIVFLASCTDDNDQLISPASVGHVAIVIRDFVNPPVGNANKLSLEVL